MPKPLERYQKLGLKESLPRIHRYPLACKELSLILRGGYRKIPKNLQSLIFQDTLTAFRHLPEMQTRNAVLASHLLLKSVEATLPKQKKNAAVTEYKNAMVAHKRRTKARLEENVSGATQLPQDVLVHIFSFLDTQSLVSVGLVCWLWNIAASENNLWQTQYTTFFGNSDNDVMIKGGQISRLIEDWREAFKRPYLVVLLENISCKEAQAYMPGCNHVRRVDSCQLSSAKSTILTFASLLGFQVVGYLLDNSLSMASSSDSDSDSDGEPFSRLCQGPLSKTQ